MSQAEIGLIGLGVMGSNLALNIAEKGNRIAVFNRTSERTDAFMSQAGDLKADLVPAKTMEDFIASIRPPRPVIIMVKAGEAVDQQIAALKKLMAKDDIIIDAGNANFRDTMRRFQELEGSGLTFIGMGVSGGEEGARHGPSIMVGGTPASYTRVEKVLTAIAAKFKGEPCCAWLGRNGAGHFVKTIHNGIEYADMQMIAEIYGVLRDGLGMAPKTIGEVFAKWNKGRLNSYLIEITAAVLAATDPKTGTPMVDVIVDSAGGYPGRRCRGLLAPMGRHVMVAGDTPLAMAQLLVPPFTSRPILGKPTRRRLAAVVDAVVAGHLQVSIAERFPLAEVEKAHQLSETGRMTGKIVMLP